MKRKARLVSTPGIILSTLTLYSSMPQMSVGAEYMLKQSKLQMTIDSNLSVKSSVETSIGPGVSLQLSADASQNSQYKFGYGVTMM